MSVGRKAGDCGCIRKYRAAGPKTLRNCLQTTNSFVVGAGIHPATARHPCYPSEDQLASIFCPACWQPTSDSVEVRESRARGLPQSSQSRVIALGSVPILTGRTHSITDWPLFHLVVWADCLHRFRFVWVSISTGPVNLFPQSSIRTNLRTISSPRLARYVEPSHSTILFHRLHAE
jgi:hypothetical protein